MKRSGLLLVLSGILVAAFFAATDARVAPHWASVIGWSENSVDAAADSAAGTVIGLTGALGLVMVGFWLAFRKSF